MLNAVSSGSGFVNVTPVRWGDRSSNSCGSPERPDAPSAAAVPNSRIGHGDRWPLRFGSLTATPHTPGSLTSGATGRVADSAGRGELLGDVAATSRGGPEGEDSKGRDGPSARRISNAPAGSGSPARPRGQAPRAGGTSRRPGAARWRPG